MYFAITYSLWSGAMLYQDPIQRPRTLDFWVDSCSIDQNTILNCLLPEVKTCGRRLDRTNSFGRFTCLRRFSLHRHRQPRHPSSVYEGWLILPIPNTTPGSKRSKTDWAEVNAPLRYSLSFRRRYRDKSETVGVAASPAREKTMINRA